MPVSFYFTSYLFFLFYASKKNSHYGAALKNGVLSDDRIVCPWHAASFDCKTGDIEDGPVLDCLPTYKVKKNEKGKLQIRIPKVDKLMKRVPKLSKKEKDNTKTFIVVGNIPFTFFELTSLIL